MTIRTMTDEEKTNIRDNYTEAVKSIIEWTDKRFPTMSDWPVARLILMTRVMLREAESGYTEDYDKEAQDKREQTFRSMRRLASVRPTTQKLLDRYDENVTVSDAIQPMAYLCAMVFWVGKTKGLIESWEDLLDMMVLYAQYQITIADSDRVKDTQLDVASTLSALRRNLNSLYTVAADEDKPRVRHSVVAVCSLAINGLIVALFRIAQEAGWEEAAVNEGE